MSLKHISTYKRDWLCSIETGMWRRSGGSRAENLT